MHIILCWPLFQIRIDSKRVGPLVCSMEGMGREGEGGRVKGGEGGRGREREGGSKEEREGGRERGREGGREGEGETDRVRGGALTSTAHHTLLTHVRKCGVGAMTVLQYSDLVPSTLSEAAVLVT